MKPSLTNALLAIAVTVAFLTGWIAFAAGTEWGRIVVVAHGTAGLALVVLAIPKSPVMQRGWRRRRSMRWIEIALSSLAVITVVSGVVQATGRLPMLGPLTMMQIHVGGGVALTVVTWWHVGRRPIRRPFDPARRAALHSVAVGVVAAGVWSVTEALLRATGTDRRFTGSHERSSFEPSGLPVTSWINDRPPPAGDTLTIDGVTMTVSQLDEAAVRIVATLDCTTGWYSTQEWHGVPLSKLIGSGRTVEVRSATGFRRRFPAVDSDHLYLATRLGGEPLTSGHGAPVRLVAPGRRGFWWVKWVSEVVTDERPWWLQSPFPLT